MSVHLKRFVQLKSATLLARELVAAGVRNRYGHLLDKGVLYKLLKNRVYIGDAVHKGVAYPGEHEAIIDRKLWDQVQAIIQESPRKRAASTRAQTPALLKGLMFGPDGAAMSPTHTRKGGRLYRYYISQSVIKRGTEATVPSGRCPPPRSNASSSTRSGHCSRPRRSSSRPGEPPAKPTKVSPRAKSGPPFSSSSRSGTSYFPAEQARIVELLVERVDLQVDGIDLRLRVEGLTSLCTELRGGAGAHQEAA